MPRGPHLGSFEMFVLLAVMRLEGEGYGITVQSEIERELDRAISIGAVYTALSRLEDRGYLVARTGEPTPQRGGRAKRLYVVSPRGLGALDRSFRTLHNMARGLGYGWSS